MTTKEQNCKYRFHFSNGIGVGYGKNYREAARTMKRIVPIIEVGMLVRIEHKGIFSYWDSREFEKELKKEGIDAIDR